MPSESPDQENGPRSESKVFISYSRKDLEFADRLDAALRARGFEPLIDRTHIYAFEEWWSRIQELIAQADTVIFVLSPDAVRPSSVALKEVSFAASLNKRFAPIVFRPVEESQIPQALAKLNFIFFNEGAVFEPRADQLAAALTTDIGWIRKHTEFGESARRWDLAGRPGSEGLLLRPPVLDEAEAWSAWRPPTAPEPTAATLALIRASRAAHLEEQARERERQAEIERSQVNLIALAGGAERARGNMETALRLCVHAARRQLDMQQSDEIHRPSAELAAAVCQSRLRLTLSGHEAPVVSAAFSRTGERIATSSHDDTLRIWNALTGEIILSLDNEGIGKSISFSPDGKLVMSGCSVSGGDEIRVWSATTGERLRDFRGRDGSVTCAAFSPDSWRMVAVSYGGTGRLWNVRKGTELAVLSGHASQVNFATFSPDGARIVTVSKDHTARVWNGLSGSLLSVLTGHEGEIAHAAFSRDGRWIVTASFDKTARLWDVARGKQAAMLRGHDQKLNHAVFSPDDKLVLTASEDNTARVWAREPGTEAAILRGHAHAVMTATFSPEGRRILTTSRDSTARIWDIHTSAEIATLSGPERRYSWSGPGAEFSPDGRRVVTTSHDHVARIWDAATSADPLVVCTVRNTAASSRASWNDDPTASERVRDWIRRTAKEVAELVGSKDESASEVNFAAVSRNGKRIVTALDDHTARIWDSRTGRLLSTLRGHDGNVVSAVFSRDAKHVVTASHDGTACLWDAKTGTKLVKYGPHWDRVNSAVFSPDGERVATTIGDRMRGRRYHAFIWDTFSGRQLALLRGSVGSFSFEYDAFGRPMTGDGGHEAEVNCAAFSPGGERLVTASDDMTARIWSVSAAVKPIVLRGHTGEIKFAAFSPDGKFVATASDDNTARIWDAWTGKEYLILRGHEFGVKSVAFSRYGKRIATASADKTARLWDAATGIEIAVFAGHDDRVNSAVFDPTGKRIVTASSDGTVRAWQLQFGARPAADLVVEACRRRLRGLTTLTRNEMRLIGYSDEMAEIDVGAGVD